MASYTEPKIMVRLAGEDLSAKQYHFVKVDTSDGSIKLAGANGKSIGILMNAPESGEPAEVALPGGGAKLKMDEAADAGKYLTSSSASQGEIADAAGEHVGAFLVETAADADIAEVLVVCFEAEATDA